MGVLDNTGLQRLWSHIQAGFGDLQAQINNLSVVGDYVPLTRKINNKELSEDINLTAEDVGAAKSELTVSLVANGTAIAENSDLNTIEFLAIGNYSCEKAANAKTLLNCPTGTAFRMEVFNPMGSTYGDEATSTWRYRVRKITTIKGDVWMQAVDSESAAGVFTYGEWKLTLTSRTMLIADGQNYGTTLPSTGVEGQIFFKQVT